MDKPDDPGKTPAGRETPNTGGADGQKPSRLELNYLPPRPRRRPGLELSLGGSGSLPVPALRQTAPARPSAAAKDPARLKLENRAEELRAALLDEQAKGRIGQQLAHERQRDALKQKLDRQYGPRQSAREESGREGSGIQWQGMGQRALTRVFGRLMGREAQEPNVSAALGGVIASGSTDRRQPEEQELAGTLNEEVQNMEDQFQSAIAKLEHTIQQAFDRGFFLDDCPSELDHGQGRDHERSDDDGGRDRER